MYRQDLFESTLDVVRGYYTSLPETIGKVLHSQPGESVPSMEELMDDRRGIEASVEMVQTIVQARGPMPSDIILMATLFMARAVQEQIHLDYCESCQERLRETIERNAQLEIVKIRLKDILEGEENEEGS